jgi:CRP-like cAMP-binding protein
VSVKSLFLNAPQRRTVAPGEVIYAEGEVGSHMYGIVEGSVELRKAGAVVAVLGSDDVFGERALIGNQRRDLTASAVLPTELAEIDRYLFLFLIDQSPTFALDVMGALASRLRNYDNWVASFATGARDSGAD